MASLRPNYWHVAAIAFALTVAVSRTLASPQLEQLSSSEIQDALQELNIRKRATAPEVSGYASQIFDTLFPGISVAGLPGPAVNALLATLYISGPPNFLLALCPPNIDPSSLSVMVAFAVGGLLGDTLFHLLPEIFLGEAEPDHARFVLVEPNKNLLLGVAILVGFVIFVMMDKGLRIATGGEGGHDHSHSHKDESTNVQVESSATASATGAQPETANGIIKSRKLRSVSGQIFDNAQLLELPPPTLRKLWQQKEPQRALDWLAETLEKDPSSSITQIALWKAYESAFAGSKVPLLEAKEFIQSNSKVFPPASAQITKEAKSRFVIAGVRPRNLSDREEQSVEVAAPRSSAPSPESKDKDASQSIRLSAYLNLIADFTHNITDGLAMSSSFYASPTLGATTAVAVFFHEIPHEVGDFALLIQSGFSKRKAMGAQFVTALGAFLGTCIGIAVQEFGKLDSVGKDGGAHGSKGLAGTGLQWGDMLLPFTAGTFLYVGTVAVIPELLETGPNKKQELKQTMAQLIAMALGAGIMLA
ncbi:hypothetical protein ACLMJK_006501 [Lecanora helva]